MNLKKLISLIKQGESATLEFKTSLAQLKAAFETVCGFLNNEGGTVLIGVNDKGKLTGQDVTDNTRQEIARELNKVEPHPALEIKYIPIENNRQIIAITAKPSKYAPYIYDDRPFWRSQSTTIRMPRDKYEQLLVTKNSAHIVWEKLANNNCSIADLDKNRIRQIIRVAVAEQRLTEIAGRADVKEILKKLDLMVDDKLTNAAVILFCKNERKQFIQSELRLARFKGTTKSEFIDNKAIRGNAFDLYERAMAFFRTYLPVSGKIEEGNPFRIDTPAIPYKVLREAVVNALCHRDYSFPGGSVNIAIYDDCVEVGSTGRLPNKINLRDLTKKHNSHPRNPLIANVFYACAMIERWGRGTQDMVELCQKSGNPKPKYIELTGSFTVMLPLKDPIGPLASQTAQQIQLTSRQQKILELLAKSPLSGAQLGVENSINIRMVQRDLTKLEKYNLIKREGKSKLTVWRLIK